MVKGERETGLKRKERLRRDTPMVIMIIMFMMILFMIMIIYDDACYRQPSSLSSIMNLWRKTKKIVIRYNDWQTLITASACIISMKLPPLLLRN